VRNRHILEAASGVFGDFTRTPGFGPEITEARASASDNETPFSTTG
jgi:hypothetical protein